MDNHMEFLLRMRRTARDARSRGRRCHYSPEQRTAAVGFLEEVEASGGTFDDAAEMMSVHRATLDTWLERETRPGGNGYTVTITLRAS